MSGPLSILGVGVYLPPARQVSELVKEAGGDPSGYTGWPRAGVAREDDHPSTMAAQALEGALRESGIPVSELKLVLSVGVSRDYLPGWSMATAVMQQHSIPHGCIGFDLMLGGTGVVTGLNLAQGWLETMGGGYAAIVSGERWSQAVDRSTPATQMLWSQGDGGTAAIVGLGTPRARVSFQGAAFDSAAEYNDLAVIKYGGTRFPVLPSGVSPHFQEGKPMPSDALSAYLRDGYTRVFAALRRRFPGPPHRLISSNVSPEIVQMVGEVAGVPPERSVVFGPETGHVETCDMLIGLRRLLDADQVDGPVVMAAHTTYACCAGYLSPPAA